MLWLLAALVAACAASITAISCNDAQSRCTFRTGCGTALNNYMLLCEEVLVNPSSRCPEPCTHALIALTSTEEGKELMSCRCDNDDEYCRETKKRIEVCRPHVIKGANMTSSCRLSHLICLADVQCNTALEYYHRFCRSVYLGRKCSKKCLNSIDILRKQDKAAGLLACRCDGNEDHDCLKMQSNLAKLCFHKLKPHQHDREKGKKKHLDEEVISNEVTPSSATLRPLPYLLQFIISLYCVFIAR